MYSIHVTIVVAVCKAAGLGCLEGVSDTIHYYCVRLCAQKGTQLFVLRFLCSGECDQRFSSSAA